MSKRMSEGQRAYEQKRADRKGMSLEKWVETKARDREVEDRARAAAAPKPPAKPGLLARLLDRAHRPLTPKS